MPGRLLEIPVWLPGALRFPAKHDRQPKDSAPAPVIDPKSQILVIEIDKIDSH